MCIRDSNVTCFDLIRSHQSRLLVRRQEVREKSQIKCLLSLDGLESHINSSNSSLLSNELYNTINVVIEWHYMKIAYKYTFPKIIFFKWVNQNEVKFEIDILLKGLFFPLFFCYFCLLFIIFFAELQTATTSTWLVQSTGRRNVSCFNPLQICVHQWAQ